MPDMPVTTGALLIEDGTMLPSSMVLERKAFSPGWKSLPNLDHHGLEAQLGQSGWTLFYMAGEIKTSGMGFDAEKRIRTAMGKVIEDVQGQKCNCLEITHMASKSFLGIPYVSVTAHARHIQAGSEFRGRS